ncbi:DUF4254 domain-containing protein [Streptomyces sp. CWNU-1]|uniref:DUF4254 domain-containing protein n=1 Tax=Streptomyces albipurpureus TaxID=2897419 RepID=A0ABT0UXS4_9ACTN|nr:DUF4254 domain-containing protein [Streptomyces sp. CWNU-1]
MLAERADEVLGSLADAGRADAPLHTETLASVVDRLSVLTLRIWHCDGRRPGTSWPAAVSPPSTASGRSCAQPSTRWSPTSSPDAVVSPYRPASSCTAGTTPPLKRSSRVGTCAGASPSVG